MSGNHTATRSRVVRVATACVAPVLAGTDECQRESVPPGPSVTVEASVDGLIQTGFAPDAGPTLPFYSPDTTDRRVVARDEKTKSAGEVTSGTPLHTLSTLGHVAPQLAATYKKMRVPVLTTAGHCSTEACVETFVLPQAEPPSGCGAPQRAGS